MKEKIEQIKVEATDNILSAIKLMDELSRKLLLVMEGDNFLSLVSIGDIQRAIINNAPLNTEIKHILRKQIKFATEKDNIDVVKQKMIERRTELMPIVSSSGELLDVIFWDEIFQKSYLPQGAKLNLPVVIMAGGKGSRLKPLTNVLPKPLIPFNEKTMLEEIMDRFVLSGCNQFYLSVNYKANMIKYYFESLNNPNYFLEYFQEDKPLGTAGSIYLLKGKIDTTFFITNCDIIIQEDYNEIYKYHVENQNEITITAALKHYPIPYGTIKNKKDGLLDTIEEKPELVFKINAGLYILEPHLIHEVPKNEFFHITDLIEKLQKENRRVGVFPVSEKSWIDIGNWEEYFRYFNLK